MLFGYRQRISLSNGMSVSAFSNVTFRNLLLHGNPPPRFFQYGNSADFELYRHPDLNKNFHEFTSKEMLSILEQECRFFEDVLEKIKPDILFIKIPALHHQELFYQMCKNTGVFVQILTYAPVGHYSMLMEDLSKLDYIKNVKDKNRSFEELQKFLYKFDLSKNIRDTSLKSENNVSNTLKSAGSFIFNSDSFNSKIPSLLTSPKIETVFPLGGIKTISSSCNLKSFGILP